ncbi:MAG: hypothetical protein KAR40_15175 [Candidatus Sabulitectum sp.]|nr:hypothetical protein [Candidatus Sabulitectum sp.]
MPRLLRVLLIAGVILGFTGLANADPSLPDTIVVNGINYTQIIINGEAYYTFAGVIYKYCSESGQVLVAEISFPI